MDIREERARYARCVYDTSDEKKSLAEFAATMALGVSSRYDERKIDESYPLLQDVIDTRKEEMADLQSFYIVWKNFSPIPVMITCLVYRMKPWNKTKL